MRIKKDNLFSYMRIRMILILSVFITHDRGNNRYNRLDIFKYTLNSYRNIKFRSV